MPPRPRIFVVRHGSTDLNRGGSGKDGFRGMLDVPLAEKGQQQALKLGQQLKDVPAGAIYSSDLQRSMETAKYIHEHHRGEDKKPLPVIQTTEFRPWNIGILEGKPTNKTNIDMVIYFVKHPYDRVPGGEPFADFVQRCTDGYRRVMKAAIESPERQPIVVTHARNVQLAELLAYYKELNPQDSEQAEAMAEEPDSVVPGGYIVLEHNGKSWKIIKRWPG